MDTVDCNERTGLFVLLTYLIANLWRRTIAQFNNMKVVEGVTGTFDGKRLLWRRTTAVFNNMKMVEGATDTFSLECFLLRCTTAQFNDMEVIGGVNDSFSFARLLWGRIFGSFDAKPLELLMRPYVLQLKTQMCGN